MGAAKRNSHDCEWVLMHWRVLSNDFILRDWQSFNWLTACMRIKSRFDYSSSFNVIGSVSNNTVKTGKQNREGSHKKPTGFHASGFGGISQSVAVNSGANVGGAKVPAPTSSSSVNLGAVSRAGRAAVKWQQPAISIHNILGPGSGSPEVRGKWVAK